jgi:hypothetical protein
MNKPPGETKLDCRPIVLGIGHHGIVDADRIEEALEVAVVQGLHKEAQTLLVALVDAGGGSRPAPEYIRVSLGLGDRPGRSYEDLAFNVRRHGHESLIAARLVNRLIGVECGAPGPVPDQLLRGKNQG